MTRRRLEGVAHGMAEIQGGPLPRAFERIPRHGACLHGEGAAHGHYRNLTNARYSSVSCGFHVSGGRVWMIQDLY